MSSALTNYSQVLLTKDVKRSFEENYLKMLFEKHRELPKSDIIEFLHKAQMTGANPSLNQIFLIERNTKVGYDWKKVGTVVFSYNFIQSVANQTGEYDGYTMQTVVMDKFDITTMETKKMLASHCVVKRRGKEFPYTAWWDEYVQTKDGKPTGTWAAKPYMMLEKCALSGALRRAFPEALSGMYCEEEMEAAANEFDKQAETNLIEAEATAKVEKTAKIIENAVAYEDKEPTLSSLTHLLGSMSEGKSVAEKSKILFDLCGVTKFSDLKSKSVEELKVLNEKISRIIEENKNRELQAEKKKSKSQPTFVLES